MTRHEFIRAMGVTAVISTIGDTWGRTIPLASNIEQFQQEIDAVQGDAYRTYLSDGRATCAAFRRLDAAFDKVLAEVKETSVSKQPAIWFVYNMGLVVKSAQTCFSIDLVHRKAPEIAPFLDFALITHNHRDHYTEEFYAALNGAGKTVISNFKDNYGVKNWRRDGGYTRQEKIFKLKDVEIRTSLTDHNDYLVDFTTAFEIRIGDFTIFHSGDCSNLSKLRPTVAPDLWIVHPRCGTDVVAGVRKLHPKQTVIAHLNELGHDRWRWSYADGVAEQAKVEAEGGRAILPLWGDRIL